MTLLPLITRAVDWLHEHLAEALDGSAIIDYEHPKPPSQNPMLEIPLLCRALCEPGVAGQVSVATRGKRDDMINRIATQSSCTSVAGDDETSYPYQLILLGLLAECGIPIRDLDKHHALIRWGYGGLQTQTRPGSAILEMRWAQRLIGINDFHGESDADLYRREVLAHDLDLVRMTDYEAYIATHVIFYLTDVGRNPWPSELLRQHQHAAVWIRRLLAHYICASHWDLVAELLLCWHALGLADSALTRYAWEELLIAQHPSGAVPGPTSTQEAEPQPDTSYHTTLVVALAAATWMVQPTVQRVVFNCGPGVPGHIDESWWSALDVLVTSSCDHNPATITDRPPMTNLGPEILRASRQTVLTACQLEVTAAPSQPDNGWEYLAVRGFHALRHDDWTLADACVAAALAKGGLTQLAKAGAEALICHASSRSDPGAAPRTLHVLVSLRERRPVGAAFQGLPR